MRRVLWIIAVFVLLAAIDAVANESRFSTAVYFEVIEFGRLVSRYVSQAF